MPPGKSATSKASCSSGSGAGSGSGASSSTGSTSGWSLIGVLLGGARGAVIGSGVVVGGGVTRWRLVELVVDIDVALVGAGPPDGQLAERLGLVEG